MLVYSNGNQSSYWRDLKFDPIKWKFLIAIALATGLAAIIALLAFEETPAERESRKRECLAVLMSGNRPGDSPYADKKSFEAGVAEKCSGFKILWD